MSEQAKLLIVDDELSVRDSLGKWFREEGYVIGAAENGSQALSLMAENSWDAALVDIKMRGIDGIELQRRMHEIDPHLMVILMTGYAISEIEQRGQAAGVDYFLPKPFRREQIAPIVRAALGR